MSRGEPRIGAAAALLAALRLRPLTATGPAARSEELSRPENAGLAATVKQLEAVRLWRAAASAAAR